MNDMNAPSALGDIAAIESRIAQLSGESRPPVAPAAGSVAAFQALLNGFSAGPGAGAGAPAPAPVAPADVERLIAGACAATGDDPALVKAVVANESGFNATATSPVGAQGLMQLMPATAAELGVSDAYDPAQNVSGGARYLAQLLQRFNGDVPLALAAYNAGPDAVEHGRIPAETRDYVRSVLSSYAQYRRNE
jgi:soluble lytic murein transglycosylase-like protein